MNHAHIIYHPVDSQNKAQDLASQILSSSSPPTISAACASIETMLHKRTPDQTRSFFTITFPCLVYKLFGFDDHLSSHKSPSSSSGCGWIDQIHSSNDSHLESRVFDLLSPSGTLLSSISSIDRQGLVKYVFPVERLPQWLKFLLQNHKDSRVLSDLCPPLFKGRIKEDLVKGSFQVQLNVFQYYFFWFAYYPVSKGNGGNFDKVVPRKSTGFRLENWTSSFPVLPGAARRPGQKAGHQLYLRLLYAYLRAFVPIYGYEASQPYRSSLLHYSTSYDGSLVLQMEFLVNALIHFWLVDNDFSPLSVDVCRSFGVSFPFRAVLGETPPTSGLAEVVLLFVKYLNSSLIPLSHEAEQVKHSASPQPRISGSVDSIKSPISRISNGGSVTSWNAMVQRPLYRFILRTFLFFPMETSIRNASQVFSVWISCMEPWKISFEDFAELDALTERKNESSRDEKMQSQVGKSASGYTTAWETYVLSNYLFYSSLTMHFLGFAHKFLHSDVETILQMVIKVLNILTSSKELIDLIKKVDAAFHSKMSGSSSLMSDSAYKYVPSIREQLQDWEDGLCETDADGSFLHENWNQDLRLLSDGEDGGHQLLQLLILRTESEIQTLSGDNASQNIQNLDKLKAQMCCLFDGNVGMIKPVTPKATQYKSGRDEIFKPRWVGNHKLADVKYKGDWMKRPVSTNEVAWLAKLLVRLSDWLNEMLRLNQSNNSCISSSWSYVEVSDNDMTKVDGPQEAVKMILCSVWSWLVFLGLSALRLMREHGWRVNLRVFASKKILVVLFLSVTFSILKKAFSCTYLQQPMMHCRALPSAVVHEM